MSDIVSYHASHEVYVIKLNELSGVKPTQQPTGLLATTAVPDDNARFDHQAFPILKILSEIPVNVCLLYLQFHARTLFYPCDTDRN